MPARKRKNNYALTQDKRTQSDIEKKRDSNERQRERISKRAEGLNTPLKDPSFWKD
jgi:hypothetical protein